MRSGVGDSAQRAGAFGGESLPSSVVAKMNSSTHSSTLSDMNRVSSTAA